MNDADIGANLTDDMYQGTYNGKVYHEPDLDDVLARAWDSGDCTRISTDALGVHQTTGMN